jgi:ABC-2 type transport system ATP-binding protein
MRTPILTFAGVRKQYGDLVALDALSIEVYAGEIFGLLGPNGAGKTTAMQLAAGLLAPDAGQVWIAGGDPREPAVRARLGAAPQALSLWDDLTGEENVAFLGRLYGLSGAALADRTRAALEFVGLTDRRRDRVSAYSGGMKRRLNLAAALVHEPQIVLLDEPTAGVDPQSRNLIFENVDALRRQGRTIVYTTHYMEEVERLCDRAAIVDRGRVLALDAPARLAAAHGGSATLVCEVNGVAVRVETTEPVAEINRLAATGVIGAFRLEQPTLEQVFLNLTGRTLRD